MLVGIISIFPEMFKAITSYGITSQAIKKGLLNIKIWDPRCFVNNLHHTVDDRPYGGGPGMLMLAKPLYDAIMAAKKSINNDTKVIYLSPQGRKLDQTAVKELASNQRLILVCGRYEGIDERIIQTVIDEEWSVGDYILSGGELAAMILIDTVSRLIPGVLNHAASAIKDSFVNGLLKYQNYSRPKVFKEIKVPDVLVSGNHRNIYLWRLKQSLGRTWLKRPDLLQKKTLNEEETRLLLEFLTEYKQ